MNGSAREPDERSLFDVMRRQILTTPMPAARRLPRIPVVRFTGRPRVLAGGATAVFAAACAAVLAVTAATTAPPAFAVTNNQDGSVTITLNEITGVSGLRRTAVDGGRDPRRPGRLGLQRAGAGRRT